MLPEILLGLCVVFSNASGKNQTGIAVDYNNHIYTIETLVNGAFWVKVKRHELKLRECTKEDLK